MVAKCYNKPHNIFLYLPDGQVKLKNNLPEAISACLGQALISNHDKANIYSRKETVIIMNNY